MSRAVRRDRREVNLRGGVGEGGMGLEGSFTKALCVVVVAAGVAVVAVASNSLPAAAAITRAHVVSHRDPRSRASAGETLAPELVLVLVLLLVPPDARLLTYSLAISRTSACEAGPSVEGEGAMYFSSTLFVRERKQGGWLEGEESGAAAGVASRARKASLTALVSKG